MEDRRGVPTSLRTGSTSAVLAVVCLLGNAPGAASQMPTEFTNLQHFPDDIARDDLIENMRHISLALGVRCQYCHVGGDGVSFQGVDFASDDDPDKIKARWMLGMMADLNRRLDTELLHRDTVPVEMSCKTCHRGISRPILLAQEIRMALDTSGRDSIGAVYDRARESLEGGVYDFNQWELNLLAEQLEGEGRADDAIAVWELNRRHHPESVNILRNLGRMYEAAGRTQEATWAWVSILTVAPGNREATARLEALRGGS